MLQGSSGSDTYVYNLGDGADIIQDGRQVFIFQGTADTNVLSFGPGITPEMVVPRRDANGRCVLDLGNGDSVDIGSLGDLVIHGVYDNNPFDGFSIQTLQFAPSPGSGQAGTIISVQDFVMARGLTQTGTDAGETLYGEDARDGWIPDRLEGGKGNDTLIGGGGSDTYVFNRGDGADTIKDGAVNDEQYGRAA